uniref:Uncharacterized protein n=1 Tax=Meloidogyne enterolobii TaxID=390850 RepID=A0A6V7WZ48_MELEN|nr:unnamed protein product [Meloidogyne enterolobii]
MDEAIMHIIEGWGNFGVKPICKNRFGMLDNYFGVSKWCADCLEFMFSGAGGEVMTTKDESTFKFCLYVCKDCVKLTTYRNYTYRHTIRLTLYSYIY